MKNTLHALDLSAEYAKHYSPLMPANDILNVALAAANLLGSKFSVTLSVDNKELEYNDICWVPTLRRLSLRTKTGNGGVHWMVITDRNDIHQAILDKREEEASAGWNARLEDKEDRDYFNVWAKA